MSYIIGPLLPFALFACIIWPWLWLLVVAFIILYVLIVNNIIR